MVKHVAVHGSYKQFEVSKFSDAGGTGVTSSRRWGKSPHGAGGGVSEELASSFGISRRASRYARRRSRCAPQRSHPQATNVDRGRCLSAASSWCRSAVELTATGSGRRTNRTPSAVGASGTVFRSWWCGSNNLLRTWRVGDQGSVCVAMDSHPFGVSGSPRTYGGLSRSNGECHRGLKSRSWNGGGGSRSRSPTSGDVFSDGGGDGNSMNISPPSGDEPTGGGVDDVSIGWSSRCSEGKDGGDSARLPSRGD